MVSDFERRRLQNQERNRRLLAQLGLDQPIIEPKAVKPQKPKASKKRKLGDDATEHAESPRPKAARKESTDTVEESGGDSAGSLRRSSRNQGKTVDYKAEQQGRQPIPVSFASGVRRTENEGPMGREAGSKRLHDPKTYGAIPGIEVGTWWETRQACSDDSIHAPWVAGIAPGPKGAYSVALSGGYADDVDCGNGFTYTGSGGRDLKGTKANPRNLRTAPQSSDQSFENNFNKALLVSSETKKPVRVIRGYKLNSPYAPLEGYRYDGLYTVEKAWLEEGLEGFAVCKYAFVRLPNQKALPACEEQDTDESAGEDQGESAGAADED